MRRVLIVKWTERAGRYSFTVNHGGKPIATGDSARSRKVDAEQHLLDLSQLESDDLIQHEGYPPPD